MSLSSTKIPYLDGVLNSDPGCSMGCSYCSTRRWCHRVPCKRCHDPSDIHQHPERLDDLKRLKVPRVIGVDFYSELFDPKRPAADILNTLEACAGSPQHTYVFLTKRVIRASLFHPYFSAHENWWLGVTEDHGGTLYGLSGLRGLPLLADARHKWVSFEPLFTGPRFDVDSLRGIEWAVIGCNSTPGDAKPFKHSWARYLLDQAAMWGTKVYVKQIPIDGRCSRDPSEWPKDLRVQEMPWTLAKKKPHLDGRAHDGMPETGKEGER